MLDLFLKTSRHVPRLRPIPRLSQPSDHRHGVEPGLLGEFAEDRFPSRLADLDSASRDLRPRIYVEVVEH